MPLLHPSNYNTHAHSTKQTSKSKPITTIMSGGRTTDEEKALAFAILEHLQGSALEGAGVEEALATLR